jgi:hypothetical protein
MSFIPGTNFEIIAYRETNFSACFTIKSNNLRSSLPTEKVVGKELGVRTKERLRRMIEADIGFGANIRHMWRIRLPS